MQEATLGAGCFWCIEAVFQELRGVESVVSGYSGGTVPGKPTYREVCSGLTGHAEVVRVRFDPEEISFRDLLVVFLSTHDPTTLNRQGADRGTQYRSVVFFHNAEQEQVAREVIADMQVHFDDPIVTEVSPLANFYVADPEHQDFYRRNPELGYCRVIIDPKMKKLRDHFASRLKNPV